MRLRVFPPKCPTSSVPFLVSEFDGRKIGSKLDDSDFMTLFVGSGLLVDGSLGCKASPWVFERSKIKFTLDPCQQCAWTL